jgi:hypothetical protein
VKEQGCIWGREGGDVPPGVQSRTRKLLKLSTNFKTFKLQNFFLSLLLSISFSLDTLKPYISSTFLPKKIMFLKRGRRRRRKLLNRIEKDKT